MSVQLGIASAKLGDLRSRFRGALIRPGDEAYAETRRIWNGAIDRRPALIARCADPRDVVTALRFARERELPISVRGTGHGVAGHAVCDAGLMIDLSLLKGVSVDRDGRRARAAGAATWGEFDLATQRFGLATTGITVSRVGVGGVTLLGGFGHLLRRYGLAVDNLRAVDLITAEGQQLHVDAAIDDRSSLVGSARWRWHLRGRQLDGLGEPAACQTALALDCPVYWRSTDQAAQVLRLLSDLPSVGPVDHGAAHDSRQLHASQ